MDKSEQWLSPSEAARKLGVSAQSIRLWSDAGMLKVVKTPLGRLVDAESAETLRRSRAAAQSRGR